MAALFCRTVSVRPVRIYPFLCVALAMASPAGARAGLETRVVCDFTVRGDLMGSDIDSHFQIDEKMQMTGVNMRVSGNGVQTEYGDVTATWDDLSFASRGFRGFKVGVPTGNLTTTFLGGSVAMQNLQGRTEISPVYGLRAGWALNKQWSLNASHLLTPEASDEQGKDITALSLAYTPRQNTRLALEMARSSGGTGWQLSAAHTGQKLTLKTLYRHADLGFSTAGNPRLNTQRSGYLADVRYKVGPLRLTALSHRFEDERGGARFS
jgi:hypothetical protein